MPAVAAMGNSQMQAVVSGSPEIARRLAQFGIVPEVLDYSNHNALLGVIGSTQFMWRCQTICGTHAMLDAVRAGKIGDAIYFAATFGFHTQADNHRLQAPYWGGALPDVGVYCLNAARLVFAAEPIAVQAMSSRPPNDARSYRDRRNLAVTL